ncbi:MAG: Holliday junction resolvase RecU [Mycoplasmataceae bacterium]|jgi:recombination protein U|nr:Holliday junction resolvase RecU [Mycoplasmataceae bacterium]
MIHAAVTNNKSNLGMYAEALMNRTCDFYKDRGIALIEKREIPIKITKNLNDSMIIGKLLKKSTVDYVGSVDGRRFEIEVKQTKNNNWSIDMLQEHQYNYLLSLKKFKIDGYVLVYFSQQEEFYLLDIEWIHKTIQNQKTRTIKYEKISSENKKIPITFPGIIDILTVINN